MIIEVLKSQKSQVLSARSSNVCVQLGTYGVRRQYGVAVISRIVDYTSLRRANVRMDSPGRHTEKQSEHRNFRGEIEGNRKTVY